MQRSIIIVMVISPRIFIKVLMVDAPGLPSPTTCLKEEVLIAWWKIQSIKTCYLLEQNSVFIVV